MINILVTGKSGGISQAFCNYMKRYPDISTVSLSLRDETWRDFDFSSVTAVFHCAGLVSGQEEALMSVNVSLTEELFRLASVSEVKQFIYLSTMAVYDYRNINEGNTADIDHKTVLAPQSAYGRSKYCAEERLRMQSRSETRLSIIRAPGIVGAGGEGDFSRYNRLLKLPFLPCIFTDKKRCFLYIDSLCELVHLIIINKESGIFLPQEEPPLSVVKLLEIIAKTLGRKLYLLPIPKCLWIKNAFTNKHFGNCCYSEKAALCFNGEYRKMSSAEVVRACIENKDK